MTATVQFRIQLPVGLRDRFKTICLRGNVTMTDKVVGLIAREVEALGKAPAPHTAKIATLNDDRLIARVVDAADRLGITASSLGAGLGKTLDGFKGELLKAMPKPLGRSEIIELGDAAVAAQARQQQAMLAKVESLHAQILSRLDSTQTAVTDAVAAKWRLWQAVAVGTAVGAAATFALLWAISGSSPARSLAVWLTGEDSDWQAAQAIAGDGNMLHGAYLSETHTLLKIPEFRQSYTRCVKRAKTRKTGFDCTVRFPILYEAR